MVKKRRYNSSSTIFASLQFRKAVPLGIRRETRYSTHQVIHSVRVNPFVMYNDVGVGMIARFAVWHCVTCARL
jgi:hypothetical protein